MIDSKSILGVLHANAHPDVALPFQFVVQFQEALGPLGKDLKLMLRRVLHYAEHLAYETK